MNFHFIFNLVFFCCLNQRFISLSVCNNFFLPSNNNENLAAFRAYPRPDNVDLDSFHFDHTSNCRNANNVEHWIILCTHL